MKKILLLFVFGFCSSLCFSQVVKHKESELTIKTSAVCGMCKTTIEKNLKAEKGVKKAVLNEETAVLTVRYDAKKTTPENIKKAVNNAGYDADDQKANPKAYEKLNACCKKEEGKKH